MPRTSILVFGAVAAFVFGCVMFVSWIPRARVSGEPIVTGDVISRTPITQWGIPRADIVIRLPDRDVTVHAVVDRYLIDQIPERVRFHDAGNPSREVYLFEQEENPLYIFLFCWGAAAILGFVVYRRWKARPTGANRSDVAPQPLGF